MDRIVALFESNNLDKMQAISGNKFAAFDKFKSSRVDPINKNYFKMSWHLTLFPMIFCVETTELNFAAYALNREINKLFR